MFVYREGGRRASRGAASGCGLGFGVSDLSGLPLTQQTIMAGGGVWRIDAVHDDGAIIDLCETHDVFPYGLKVWESAVVMADYFAAEGLALKGVSVMELGAGIALPGMVAAKLGARVTATDHNQIALDLGAHNASANDSAAGDVDHGRLVHMGLAGAV